MKASFTPFHFLVYGIDVKDDKERERIGKFKLFHVVAWKTGLQTLLIERAVKQSDTIRGRRKK